MAEALGHRSGAWKVHIYELIPVLSVLLTERAVID